MLMTIFFAFGFGGGLLVLIDACAKMETHHDAGSQAYFGGVSIILAVIGGLALA